MKVKSLEKKIKKATIKKDYVTAKFILTDCYTKHFRKMLKRKKVKIDKAWLLHDYLLRVQAYYPELYFNDIERMLDALYSGNKSDKEQIVWLLENVEVFNEYK